MCLNWKKIVCVHWIVMIYFIIRMKAMYETLPVFLYFAIFLSC